MIPCVILASVLKDNHNPSDLVAFQNEYKAFQPGTVQETPWRIQLHEADDNDGGNGGGGEAGGRPMKATIARNGRCFWDFKTHPAGDRDTKFPRNMRFEVCLPFGDIKEAAEFLAKKSAGQRIRDLFTYVEIVAVSQAA